MRFRRRNPYSRIWAGLFLLVVGGVLLLDQLGFPLPDFLFHWPLLLIALGVFAGFRCRFRGGMWFLAIVIGGCFLYRDYFHVDIERFIWPVVIISIGIAMILRPRSRFSERHEEFRRRREMFRDALRGQRDPFRDGGPSFTGKDSQGNPYTGQANPYSGPQDASLNDPGGQAGYFSHSRENPTSEDYVNVTAIFSGVHKKVMSKNFKGGDITAFMGGTEIDLTQADFTGQIRIDVTQILGATKIVVPPHWEVRSEVTALFAGFEDKRQQPAIVNPEKVLILDGTSVFGGIELKNF